MEGFSVPADAPPLDDTHLYLSIAGFVLCIVLAAFFAGSETALTAASRARMQQLASGGAKRAKLVTALQASRDQFIGALLVGNTTVSIFISALASTVLFQLMGHSGVAIGAIATTALVLVFGEVLPKTLAINRADKTALAVAPVVYVFIILFKPIVLMVNAIVRLLLLALGVDIRKPHYHDDNAELLGAIELHRKPEEDQPDGLKDEVRSERAMLRSILDLAELTVSQVMTHRRNVTLIDIDQPVGQVIGDVLAAPFTRIPLWREHHDNVVGVINAKSLLRELHVGGRKPEDLDLLAISARPWFIPDTTTLLDQLNAFRQRREHFALVVDEYGTLMGVITLEDILEEIVGNIEDEHDKPVTGVTREESGSYRIEGDVPIRDLNREFDLHLPSDHYTTVAGLVLYEARRIPEVGQIYSFFGHRFEILARQRHQVTLIRVTLPDEEQG